MIGPYIQMGATGIKGTIMQPAAKLQGWNMQWEIYWTTGKHKHGSLMPKAGSEKAFLRTRRAGRDLEDKEEMKK